MVVRIVSLLAVALVTLVGTVPVKADWLAEFCYSVARDTKRRNCWPKPFVCADRYAARAPFAVMINNGWRLENTLGEYHFSQATNELTEAGRLKVEWIVFQGPEQHRAIYVDRGDSPDTTAKRVDSVQQLVARLSPQGPMPAVVETGIPAPGWPAAHAENVVRKFETAFPDPRVTPQENKPAQGRDKSKSM